MPIFSDNDDFVLFIRFCQSRLFETPSHPDMDEATYEQKKSDLAAKLRTFEAQVSRGRGFPADHDGRSRAGFRGPAGSAVRHRRRGAGYHRDRPSNGGAYEKGQNAFRGSGSSQSHEDMSNDRHAHPNGFYRCRRKMPICWLSVNLQHG